MDFVPTIYYSAPYAHAFCQMSVKSVLCFCCFKHFQVFSFDQLIDTFLLN